MGIFLIFTLIILYIAFKKKHEEKHLELNISSLSDEEEIPINIENASSIDNIVNVKIKDNQVDTSRIIEYTGTEIKCYQWQPINFSQYVGQEEAKEQAKTIIKKANKGIKSHLLLSAIQGHGKSLYVKLLAKELNARYIERIGKSLDYDTIVDVINEINTCPEQKVIFFLDETDTCDYKVLKILNPILQDFKLNNKKIKPFIFAGASINKDLLISRTPDVLDRIQHQIQLKRYNINEIKTILKQYILHLYSEENISENVIEEISKQCKFNPRLSIGILEDYVVTKNLTKTLKDRRIIKDGLTEIDIKILEVLSNTIKPLGANALAQRIGLSQNQYTREYEPYLAEFNYLKRVPSRQIAEEGLKIIKELKDEKLLQTM